MSVEKQRREAERWLRQAEDDLDAARLLLTSGKFAQSAFFSQQAGEKAMKAVWLAMDADPWGPSLGRLVKDLPDPEVRVRFAPLLDAALALDKLYIPTRYPDALADLIPGEAYTQREAEAALAHSEAILQAVREWMAERPAERPDR